MKEKEVENPVIISNFEINKKNNAVVIFINPKIFPVSIVNKSAIFFKEKSWIVIDSNDDEILVELKPKQDVDLEILAREFNNKLLEESTKDIKVDAKSNALVSKIKEVVTQFITEEQGKVSKQSILVVASILASLGLSGIVSASHLCGPSGEGVEGAEGTESKCETAEGASCG